MEELINRNGDDLNQAMISRLGDAADAAQDAATAADEAAEDYGVTKASVEAVKNATTERYEELSQGIKDFLNALGRGDVQTIAELKLRSEDLRVHIQGILTVIMPCIQAQQSFHLRINTADGDLVEDAAMPASLPPDQGEQLSYVVE